MARKRMIDPNIWSDEGFLELSFPARLLFIGMVSNADDEGRGIANPKSLKARIFPADEITLAEVDELKKSIKNHTHVVFFEKEGCQYYALEKWETYQTINRPTPSHIPNPSENSEQNIPENDDSLNDHGTLTESSLNDHGTLTTKGKERKGKEENKERVRAMPENESSEIFSLYSSLHLEKTGTKPVITGKDGSNLKRILQSVDPESVSEKLREYYKNENLWFTKRGGYSFSAFSQHFNEITVSTYQPKKKEVPRCPQCGSELIDGMCGNRKCKVWEEEA